MGVVKIIKGPELHYGLVDAEAEEGPGSQEKGLHRAGPVTRGEGMSKGIPAFDQQSSQRYGRNK
jgi:hypothetical protein